MRGLRKYLTPFAPDQSGAVSVLYELGGLIAICDAGGCTGNVCDFDEPRWFEQKSALFSAGLRDMDAILGRDDRLVEKLVDAASKLDVKFVAIIGTPVPAVIGTDYKALGRMCEKKLNMPVITIDTDGMELYDVGEEKAWLELFRTFAEKEMIDKASERIKPNLDIEKKQGKIGVLGLTPQDISDLQAPKKIREYYQEKEGKEAICYCMGENVCRSTDGLDNHRTAGEVEKNIVVSPAALAAAKYLEKTFGTLMRYLPNCRRADSGYGLSEKENPDCASAGYWKCNACRNQTKMPESNGDPSVDNNAVITVASWFMMKQELSEKGDISLREEDDYMELIKEEDYDIVFADPMMKRMTEDAYKMAGTGCVADAYETKRKRIFIDATHFAVSGKLREEMKKREA